jgi:hypothetical protein
LRKAETLDDALSLERSWNQEQRSKKLMGSMKGFPFQEAESQEKRVGSSFFKCRSSVSE